MDRRRISSRRGTWTSSAIEQVGTGNDLRAQEEDHLRLCAPTVGLPCTLCLRSTPSKIHVRLNRRGLDPRQHHLPPHDAGLARARSVPSSSPQRISDRTKLVASPRAAFNGPGFRARGHKDRRAGAEGAQWGSEDRRRDGGVLVAGGWTGGGREVEEGGGGADRVGGVYQGWEDGRLKRAKGLRPRDHSLESCFMFQDPR